VANAFCNFKGVDGARFRAAPSWYVSLSRAKDLSHLALAHTLTWRDTENHREEMRMISRHVETLREKSARW